MKQTCAHCKKEIKGKDLSYNLRIFSLDIFNFKDNVLCEECMNKLINSGEL